MTISAVGSAAQSSGSTTLNVSPTATGDALVFVVSTTSAPSSIAVSGGGVTTWTRATSYLDTGNNCYVDIWLGVITSTGAATITVTGITGGGTGMLAQQFNESNGGYTWSVGNVSNAPGSSGSASGSGTSITYPSLTAAASGDSLYFGHCFSIFGTMNSGSTTGYTYSVAGTTARQAVWNPAFSGTGSPTATQTNTGAFDQVAAIINAAPGAAPSALPAQPLVVPSLAAIQAASW